MSRSLVVPVPSIRRAVAVLLTVAAAAAVLLVGIRLGNVLLRPTPVMSIANGQLAQVQLLNGAVYLGSVVSDEGGVIRISGAALLRQETPTASGQGGPRLIVQSLATDPYSIASDILIPIDQVALIGAVAPSSSLGQAYSQAMGTTPSPSRSASP